MCGHLYPGKTHQNKGIVALSWKSHPQVSVFAVYAFLDSQCNDAFRGLGLPSSGMRSSGFETVPHPHDKNGQTINNNWGNHNQRQEKLPESYGVRPEVPERVMIQRVLKVLGRPLVAVLRHTPFRILYGELVAILVLLVVLYECRLLPLPLEV